MQKGLLHAHSWLRWVLLAVLIATIIASLIGWLQKKPFKPSIKRLLLFSTIIADVQLLIGLVMYFFTSAITKTAFEDFGKAMSEASLRYYAVEHILAMIIGITLLHIGKSKATKAETDEAKHKKVVIFFVIGLVIMLARIPFSAGRLGF